MVFSGMVFSGMVFPAASAASGGGWAGKIDMHGGETVPSGRLECNGAAVSRTTYADLFAAIGVLWGAGDGSTTFNLPDLRGMFVRGWDHGAGTDPDVATRTGGDHVGSSQGDAFKSHRHTVKSSKNASGQLTYDTFYQGWVNDGGTNNTSYTGGNETRPENVNIMYVIQY